MFAFLLLTVVLSACRGQAAASWPGITVDGETAYMAYNQYVYAVDLNSGSLDWRFPEEKPESNTTFFARPALTPEGNIIVGSFTQGGAPAKLYSLDAQGRQQWVFDQAKFHYIAQPLITEDSIFAPNADGNLYALNFNGSLRWQFSTERALWASPTANEDCDCIFVASMDHSLYSLDAKTGNEIWKTPDLGGALAAPPTFGTDGNIFIGTSGNQMLALDAKTGNTRWSFDSEGWIWSEAAMENGTIYFGDLKGYFYALEAETGREIWRIQTDGAILSKPLVLGDRIFYTTDTQTVYAIDLNGASLWERETDAKVYAPVVSAGDFIVVATTNSEKPLIAYNENGDLKWSLSLAEE
jgi:outer membrane protein assembly factor BamB